MTNILLFLGNVALWAILWKVHDIFDVLMLQNTPGLLETKKPNNKEAWYRPVKDKKGKK